jgi:hypothetical protein
LRERQRQIELSRQRSETHIGHKMPPSQSCLKTSSPP